MPAIDLPPGVVRTGTEYTSRGRFYDANLWRWFSGAAGPIGGWEVRSLSPVSGKGRALLPWSDNDAIARAGIGTHTHLYVMSRSGSVSNITPVGFVSGRPDAIVGAGYGAGPYGMGGYGLPIASVDQINPASVWSLDTWGEYLIGCMEGDGRIWEWRLNTAVVAASVANAPTARAVLSTAERILMALGADDDPRKVAWSHREDNTEWTSTATNYAGEFTLQTRGKIITGRQIDGGNLIWTDVDLWLTSFQGLPFVYGFQRRGEGCGAISMNCMAVTDAGVFWMGSNGFFAYNGYAQPLACEVHDFVFNDINAVQLSKVYALHNSAFGEVTWRYPSAGQTEIDRYVTYNYRERHWTIGSLVRLAGADKGVFPYVLEVDADGDIYDHEKGFVHDGVSPFARIGPVELGDGVRVLEVQELVPDLTALGDVTVTFHTRDRPNGAETNFGPYSLAAKTDLRFTARQVAMTFTGDDGADFRVGRFRLDGKEKGLR